MKRKMMLGVVLLTVLTNAFADITVSDVEAFSGYPWKEVVIGYTIAGANGNCFFLQAKDLESGKSYVAARTNVSGADFTPGRHMLKWNMAADGIRIRSNRVEFSLKVWDLKDYCVIDLAEGATAQHFPVEYVDKIDSDINEQRQIKLCFKLIWPGKFKMQNQYDVTITKPFYMGIFPMTQKQYELVTGENPSSGAGRNERKGGTRPVQNVSYLMIRGNLQGAQWPINNLVDASSFLGVLRAKTGIAFDLPTEAKWEYACRAGTTTTYSFGDTVISSMVYEKWFGYYSYVYEYGDAFVGCNRPNAWGLYDMHGLVWEWCLDWYGNICEATDPKGVSSGSGRVLRGGDWNSDASKCTSSYRCGCDPSARNAGSFPTEEDRGFRLSMTIEE